MAVVLNRVEDCSLANLGRAAIKGEKVVIGEDGKAAMAAAQQAFAAYVTDNPEQFIYGVTSDYGPHAEEKLDADSRASRRSGGVPFLGLSFGDGHLEDAQVKAIIFALLALFLGKGAAVRPEAAEALARALEGPLPQIPDGALTSPGEILPLFYLYQAKCIIW